MSEPPNKSFEPLWTVEEVARFLRVSKSWVYRAAEEGKLPYTKVGALLRFVPAAIQNLATKP